MHLTQDIVCSKLNGIRGKEVFYTDKTVDLLGKLADKLRIKEIVVAFLIAGLFMLFAPERFLDMLGLQVWRDTYRSHIGAEVLICAILCIIWILGWIKDKIVYSTFTYVRISRSYLKQIISTEEKDFLIQHFYNLDTNEFKSTAELNISSGNVALLTNAYIISRASNVAHSMSHWAYCLQPNVRKYLNKAVKRKKIVVGRNSYTWKL